MTPFPFFSREKREKGRNLLAGDQQHRPAENPTQMDVSPPPHRPPPPHRSPPPSAPHRSPPPSAPHRSPPPSAPHRSPPPSAPHRSPPPLAPPHSNYSLPPSHFSHEDILFCVDVDVEARMEIKPSANANSKAPSRPPTRLHAVEAAIRHFVHAKLSINPGHRFALSILHRSFSWVRREFTNDAAVIIRAMRSLTFPPGPSGSAELTSLFRAAADESFRSRAEGRLLRVVLIYCRSSTMPVYQWPATEKLFTLDVMYLHDKPTSENDPQAVYDVLGDASESVSEYEGYVMESNQGVSRICRFMYMLLCHPQQRCRQDDLDIPKPIAKKMPPAIEGASNEDNISMSSTSCN